MTAMKTYDQLLKENESLQEQLEEATETIHAIRTGQVDAIVVRAPGGRNQLYTLKTADQTYRVFIEKMNEGAVTLNEDGVILYCNSMFASMVNMPLSKVVGQRFDYFIPDIFKEIYVDLFENGWVEDGKTELSIVSGDRLVPCQLSVTTLQLDEGTSLSLILTDLTFQKEVQQLLKLNNERLEEINSELEISNHDLQQFASIASHDLQEPLRKILIFATMLRNHHLSDFSVEGLSHLDKIIGSSKRMRTMTSDILTYSRLSTHINNYTLTNLSEVVGEVLEDYEILIQEKKANIIIGELPQIEVNRGQIKQVFQNLISNSIKFAKKDKAPEIKISSEFVPVADGETDAYLITVLDNGIGFDTSYTDRIFSLFERLNTKDKYEGSGIGLAITKKIIDKHNGSISARSEEGKGSSFIISLPARQA